MQITSSYFIGKYMSVLHHCKSVVQNVTDFRLLIHSNTEDGSIIFTDSGGDNRSLSCANVSHDTAQAKFGNSSILFPDTLNGSMAPSAGVRVFAESLQDYTFELWYKASAAPYGYILLFSSNYYFSISSSGAKPFLKFGTSYYYSPTSLLTAVWYHLALMRKNGTLYIFVDGILKVIASVSDTAVISALPIGSNSSALRGWADEIAFRNIAAWDCSGAAVGDQVFTPPTAPYEA